jgi:hypothetical protein
MLFWGDLPTLHAAHGITSTPIVISQARLEGEETCSETRAQSSDGQVARDAEETSERREEGRASEGEGPESKVKAQEASRLDREFAGDCHAGSVSASSWATSRATSRAACEQAFDTLCDRPGTLLRG